MMTDFMGYDIGFGKFAGGMKSVFQFVKKRSVEIDLLIVRAIERAGSRGGRAARGLYQVGIEHELRVAVAASHVLEKLPPHVFRVGEHDRHELADPVFFTALDVGWTRGTVTRLVRRLGGLSARRIAV